jgi:small-conductance mechanosensitive channel
MSKLAITKTDVTRVCDPRRVVAFGGDGLARKSGFDGVVVFSAVGVLTLLALAIIGAPISSVLLVAFGFVCLIAIAAREYIADIAAGAVLRYAQPYKPGDTVHLYCLNEHRYVDATVVKLGPVRTSLESETGSIVAVPNHSLLVDESRKDAA